MNNQFAAEILLHAACSKGSMEVAQFSSSDWATSAASPSTKISAATQTKSSDETNALDNF
jgi:hypothetical protein